MANDDFTATDWSKTGESSISPSTHTYIGMLLNAGTTGETAVVLGVHNSLLGECMAQARAAGYHCISTLIERSRFEAERGYANLLIVRSLLRQRQTQ